MSYFSGNLNKVKCVRNWAIDTAKVLFDGDKNDLRALPKTVRLQILTTLSFVWSTAFTLYIFGIMRPDIWTLLVVGHIAVIMAIYYTFKQFHNLPYKVKNDDIHPIVYDDTYKGIR